MILGIFLVENTLKMVAFGRNFAKVLVAEVSFFYASKCKQGWGRDLWRFCSILWTY